MSLELKYPVQSARPGRYGSYPLKIYLHVAQTAVAVALALHSGVVMHFEAELRWQMSEAVRAGPALKYFFSQQESEDRRPVKVAGS